MKPFLNWAGGKRWLVAHYPGLLAVPSQRLIEPFLGSGAVFFHVQPPSALLADSNEQLIEAYAAVRDEPEKILRALRDHQRQHGNAHYYQVRAEAPRTAVDRAAKFIYLNRTCFNGLYRVNLRGEFNVPKGTKEAVLLPDDDFAVWAAMLGRAQLVAQDFEETLDNTGHGDFIYADPPYTVNHNVNNFVKYNERIFSWADQIRLAERLSEATNRGACVVMSNADHASVRGLYSTAGWTCLTVNRHSRLAASSAHRRATTELLIANCLDEDGGQTEPRVCGKRTLSNCKS
jgi:DNA adenine methylase